MSHFHFSVATSAREMLALSKCTKEVTDRQWIQSVFKIKHPVQIVLFYLIYYGELWSTEVATAFSLLSQGAKIKMGEEDDAVMKCLYWTWIEFWAMMWTELWLLVYRYSPTDGPGFIKNSAKSWLFSYFHILITANNTQKKAEIFQSIWILQTTFSCELFFTPSHVTSVWQKKNKRQSCWKFRC